jgi:hypothetical protein
MNDSICWLVTVLYERRKTLLRCALKVKRNDLPGEWWCGSHPMEPENRAAIHALLPAHVRECGPVVDVQEIFEVWDLSGKEVNP